MKGEFQMAVSKGTKLSFDFRGAKLQFGIHKPTEMPCVSAQRRFPDTEKNSDRRPVELPVTLPEH